MMITVSRSYPWASPRYMETEMYCDDIDIHGIGFWYQDVKDQHKDLESRNKK